MRVLDAIVTREAKEQRGLLALALAAGPLLVYFGQVTAANRRMIDELTVTWLIPGVTLLLWWALILDSSTRDAGSDTGTSLSRLPISAVSFLAGKVIWLACVGVILSAWIHLAEGLIAFFGGGAPASFTSDLYSTRSGTGFIGAMVAGAYALAMGLWLRRPLLVVAAGMLGLAGLSLGEFKFGEGIQMMPEVVPFAGLASILMLGALLAAWVVTRPGYLLPREGMLRSVGFVVVLGGVTAGMALAHLGDLANRMRPRFGVDSVRHAEVSPDGNRVCVIAQRSYDNVLGVQAHDVANWIIDLKSGCLEWASPANSWVTRQGGGIWRPDGSLFVKKEASRFRGKSFIESFSLDPARGALVPEASSKKAKSKQPKRVGRGYQVHLPGEDKARLWKFVGSPEFSVIPGRAYSVSPQGVVEVHDIASGESIELHRLDWPKIRAGSGLTESPDGCYLHIRSMDDRESVYLDAASGAVLDVLPAGWMHAGWTGATHPIAHAQETQVEGGANRLWGLDGLYESPGPRFDDLQALQTNELLALGDGALWIIDTNGRFLRSLYTPEVVVP